MSHYAINDLLGSASSDELAKRDQFYTSCIQAIRGEVVPDFPIIDEDDEDALEAEEQADLLELCVVHGIRHHDGFATSLHSTKPVYTRALNARAIMSNNIPEIRTEEGFPYCIWCPDIATEDTYRSLVQSYPQLRYQVGRACAVAGYFELYKDLDILPEVHIAEEARDAMARTPGNNGSAAIYKQIMSASIKYKIMNDYTCIVSHDHPQPSSLNADTAVLSLLNLQHDYKTLRFRERAYFDLCEDQQLGESTTPQLPTSPKLKQLFYTPLAQDLLLVDKDLLILSAAYHGNIDRYARLARPTLIRHEKSCLIRGIYHNPLFAKYISERPPFDVTEAATTKFHPHFEVLAAIHARFIMSNDISHITSSTPSPQIPYHIYYPSIAHADTYAALYKIRPDMLQQIVRACIIADYVDLYKTLAESADFQADIFLRQEAMNVVNKYYIKDLTARVQKHGGWIGERTAGNDWKMRTRKDMWEPVTQGKVNADMDMADVEIVAGSGGGDGGDGWWYNGCRVDLSALESFCMQ